LQQTTAVQPKVSEIAENIIKVTVLSLIFLDMTQRAGPWTVVAGNHIENVMNTVKTCLLPPTNVTQEVTELQHKS